MSGPVAPPDPVMTFPVVTEAGFPHGLCCYHCTRPLYVGQPFAAHLDAMGAHSTVEHLACAYCECDGS